MANILYETWKIHKFMKFIFCSRNEIIIFSESPLYTDSNDIWQPLSYNQCWEGFFTVNERVIDLCVDLISIIQLPSQLPAHVSKSHSTAPLSSRTKEGYCRRRRRPLTRLSNVSVTAGLERTWRGGGGNFAILQAIITSYILSLYGFSRLKI